MSQTVHLTIGLPASGKSTWLRDHHVEALSTDHLRVLLLDDIHDQSNPALIHETCRYLLEVRLCLSRPVTYVDATNLVAEYRRPFLRTAQAHGATVEALWFDTPLEVCLERNRARQRRVPEDVIREMAARLDPPTLEEGFGRVTRITPDA